MQLVEAIPGFRHSGEWNRGGLSEGFVDLWLLDPGALTSIAALPWVRDGVDEWDNPLLRAWLTIAMVDIELGKRVAGFTWMSGRVGEAEWVWLTGLGSIASRDLELAGAVAAIPWFTEDGSGYAALAQLAEIASKDLELARAVAALPWFADGATGDEATTLFYLDRAASTDLEFARALVGRPWFTYSVTEVHWGTVHDLESILSTSPELARVLSKMSLSRDSHKSFLSRARRLLVDDPDIVSRITSQPWFEDGLDREEEAFVLPLLDEASMVTNVRFSFFEALLEGRYTQSKTVSLPLAGEVGIWVFQSAPFSSGEDTPTLIEELVRSVEEFVGAPLPTTDVIVLIEGYPPDMGGSSVGGRVSHIKIGTDYAKGIGHVRYYIIQEIAAHYRFSSPWLNEIFADYVEGHVSHSLGIRSMEFTRDQVSLQIQRSCAPEELATISDALRFDRTSRGPQPGVCTSFLGLSFLYEAFDLIGEEGMAAALRDLSMLVAPGADAAEEAVFRALLGHTPPDRQEEFRDLYRRLHGGSYEL